MDKLNILFQSIMTLYALVIAGGIIAIIYGKKDRERIQELETEIETLKKQRYPQNVESYPKFSAEDKP